jgi:hypothetical protein
MEQYLVEHWRKKHANPKTQQETGIIPTQQTTTQPKHMNLQESEYDGNKVAKEVSEATRHNQVLEELERTRIKKMEELEKERIMKTEESERQRLATMEEFERQKASQSECHSESEGCL